MTPTHARSVHLTDPELRSIEAAAQATRETVAGYLRRVGCESAGLPAPAARRPQADPLLPGVARPRRPAAPGVTMRQLAVWLLDEPGRVSELAALVDSIRAARIATGER